MLDFVVYHARFDPNNCREMIRAIKMFPSDDKYMASCRPWLGSAALITRELTHVVLFLYVERHRATEANKEGKSDDHAICAQERERRNHDDKPEGLGRNLEIL